MSQIKTDQGDVFDDLSLLGTYEYLNRAAVYTIWTEKGQSGNYELLYIGQSGEMGTRLDRNHHKYQCWLNHSNGKLFVAFRWLPSSQYTEQQRLTMEQMLIRKYNPICNG